MPWLCVSSFNTTNITSVRIDVVWGMLCTLYCKLFYLTYWYVVQATSLLRGSLCPYRNVERPNCRKAWPHNTLTVCWTQKCLLSQFKVGQCLVKRNCKIETCHLARIKFKSFFSVYCSCKKDFSNLFHLWLVYNIDGCREWRVISEIRSLCTGCYISNK